MALKIYTLNESTFDFEEVSAGTFASPVATNVKPGGSSRVQKLYLRNDDNAKRYSNIILKPVTTTGGTIIDGTISIKLLSGSTKPTNTRWASASANNGATIESPLGGGPADERIPEIGAVGAADLTYYPFWIRVESTKSAPIGDTRFSLQVSYTEDLV